MGDDIISRNSKDMYINQSKVPKHGKSKKQLGISPAEAQTTDQHTSKNKYTTALFRILDWCVFKIGHLRESGNNQAATPQQTLVKPWMKKIKKTNNHIKTQQQNLKYAAIISHS